MGSESTKRLTFFLDIRKVCQKNLWGAFFLEALFPVFEDKKKFLVVR